MYIGEVVRYNANTGVNNLDGRQTNTSGSSMKVSDAHDIWWDDCAPGCMYNLPLPRGVRIVYVDVRKVSWCSVGSPALHSFV